MGEGCRYGVVAVERWEVVMSGLDGVVAGDGLLSHTAPRLWRSFNGCPGR